MDYWNQKPKKKKKYPFRRWCKAKCSQDCETIFKSDYKRTKVCPACAKRLAELKINIKRYLKMNDKPQYEEKATWKDDNTCELVFTESKVLKDQKGKVLGTSKQGVTVEAKKDDMEANLQFKMEELMKREEEANNIMMKIKGFGKKPVMTNEMIRLKKNLSDIQKAEEITNLQNKLKQIDDAIKEMKEFITIRRKTLASAPKKED